MSGREHYWQISLEDILDEYNIELSTEVIAAIAKDLAIAAEMESEALGYTSIPNPLHEEIQKLQQARKDDQKEAEQREEILRKDIARRVHPTLESRNVCIRDGRVEIWDR
jgi:1,6-anhydro-N-acetylmuramate kinase